MVSQLKKIVSETKHTFINAWSFIMEGEFTIFTLGDFEKTFVRVSRPITSTEWFVVERTALAAPFLLCKE